MRHIYKTTNTCCKEIQFDLENGIVTNVEFLSPLQDIITFRPAFLNIFSASVIVLFITEGTVIELLFEFIFASSEVIPK